MPEAPELRIMCDYINQNVKNKVFIRSFHVEKGNNPIEFKLLESFQVESNSFGKELKIRLFHDVTSFDISVFMGMSGNWKFVPTKDWNNTRFIRMRLDTDDGYSLILYGSYMGPKYRIGGFTGVKRGPDSVKQFDHFKDKILNNLNKKLFDKPICEVILNQEYFNGIGNYLRSTAIYYLDINPFESARSIIQNNPEIFDVCRDVQIKAYELGGGQLIDWSNPFDTDCVDFKKWVFYQKGISCKDGTGRTFWYNEKWKNQCPY